MFENISLALADRLPVTGNLSGQVPESNLSMSLSVVTTATGLGRVFSNGGNGGSAGFFRSAFHIFVTDTLEDSCSCILEENIVRAQWTLGLVFD